MSKNKYLIYLLVFISGLAIMAIEMTASRILVPFFGNSLFVWANIIGIVMVVLSLGYYFGGKLADWRPEFNLLMYIVLIGGIFALMIPLVYKTVIIFIMRQISFQLLIIGSLLSTIILFLFPVLLGIVSPCSIRLLIREVHHSGNVSGSVYALGDQLGFAKEISIFTLFINTPADLFFNLGILKRKK